MIIVYKYYDRSQPTPPPSLSIQSPNNPPRRNKNLNRNEHRMDLQSYPQSEHPTEKVNASGKNTSKQYDGAFGVQGAGSNCNFNKPKYHESTHETTYELHQPAMLVSIHKFCFLQTPNKLPLKAYVLHIKHESKEATFMTVNKSTTT